VWGVVDDRVVETRNFGRGGEFITPRDLRERRRRQKELEREGERR
jgi:hypothetical protein